MPDLEPNCSVVAEPESDGPESAGPESDGPESAGPDADAVIDQSYGARRDSIDSFMAGEDKEDAELLAFYKKWDGLTEKSWDALDIPSSWHEFNLPEYKAYIKGPLFFRQLLIDQYIIEPPPEVISEALMVAKGAQIPEWWGKVKPPQYTAFLGGLEKLKEWLIAEEWLVE
jgi:hypothetical protein